MLVAVPKYAVKSVPRKFFMVKNQGGVLLSHASLILSGLILLG